MGRVTHTDDSTPCIGGMDMIVPCVETSATGHREGQQWVEVRHCVTLM